MKMTVYHVFDTMTGKAYVGQTRYSLKSRIRGHLRRSNTCLFGQELRKRPDDFVWTVLVEVETEQELDDAETAFIREFGTLVPNGYNKTLGRQGHILSEETRRKIGDRHRGRKHSTVSRMNMSEAHLGKSGCRLGVRLSDETKAKISQNRQGKSMGHAVSEETRAKISAARKSYWRNKRCA